MSTKTKRSSNPIPTNLAEAEELMGQIAKADADIRRLSAEMDKELAAIREKYAGSLDTIKAIQAEALELIESFAWTHPEFFTDKKTLSLAHGDIGFRTGTPAVSLLPRVKMEAAMERARSFDPNFIAIKETLGKDAILAAYAAKTITDENLRTMGLRITQTERFFADPKREEVTA